MRESKSLALPLGDTPMALGYYNIKLFCCQGVKRYFKWMYLIYNGRKSMEISDFVNVILFSTLDYGAVVFYYRVLRVIASCHS